MTRPVWKVIEWTVAAFIALMMSAILFGCVPNVDEAIDEASDRCEKIVRDAQRQTAADCQKLVDEQVEAGLLWLKELARALGCVQVIDPVDGPTSEWDCTAVCERAPDSVIIP